MHSQYLGFVYCGILLLLAVFQYSVLRMLPYSVTVYRLSIRLPAKSALTWPVVSLIACKPSQLAGCFGVRYSGILLYLKYFGIRYSEIPSVFEALRDPVLLML